ncbi:cysteine dioxygenase [Streptomyces sp. NBC_01803]|uniref:cysteine dioxygenase n=1 Tax=Streptomyces sp. NBC_01803 TaxID=2975946 RepID=UPI002DDA8498|nr:cysteine dioxygenase family protein [Streptomyces sp. NBC_01803]WSA43773.1 cysteine dioxygenase family protein [Streptomyces sp. NBC_01803]
MSALSPALSIVATPASTGTPARLAATARRFAAHPRTWRPFVRFTRPDRWYRRLELTADYEVWLLTWLPGQGTEIHDHGGSSGAFTVVDGTLAERAFPAPGRRGAVPARPLDIGGLRSFGPRYIHEVRNEGTLPAVSIHVYGPALSSQSFYRRDADGVLTLDRTEPVAH